MYQLLASFGWHAVSVFLLSISADIVSFLLLSLTVE